MDMPIIIFKISIKKLKFSFQVDACIFPIYVNRDVCEQNHWEKETKNELLVAFDENSYKINFTLIFRFS